MVRAVGQFTSVGFQEMADVCLQFDCGVLQTMESLVAGTINSNFALTTDQGRWFARVNEGKSLGDVQWEAALLAYISAQGPQCPVVNPTKTADGAIAIRLSSAPQKWICLFPWQSGRHLDAVQVMPNHARAVGAALAHLHVVCAQQLDVLGRHDRYDFDHIVQRYHVCVAAHDKVLMPALAIVGDELALVSGHLSLRDASSRSIIHGDLFRDNVLMHGNSISTILDFEQASSGTVTYDIAVAIHDWCWQQELQQADWSLIAALVGGYQTVSPLTKAEIVALPWDLRMAAARFTVTRMTDVYLAGLHTDGKDFRAFLARVNFWRAPAARQKLIDVLTAF
jgi:homoserine kinase type II